MQQKYANAIIESRVVNVLNKVVVDPILSVLVRGKWGMRVYDRR